MIELPFDYTPLRREGETNRDLYWRYVFERQAVYHRRFVLKLPRPWTNDEVLDKFSFTNVYRELDRGTIHYRTNCWEVIKDFPVDAQLFWTAVYRWFNRPEVWDTVLVNYTWLNLTPEMIRRMGEAVRDYGQKTGLPVWTGAYMVCAYHNSPGKDKIERVTNFLIKLNDRLSQFMSAGWTTTEEFHKALQESDGIGPFGAYEIMSDLLMVNWTPFANRGFTENDWANPGPGAEAGLKLVFGRTEKYSRARMQEMMRELRDEQRFAFADLQLPFASVAIQDPHGPRWLTMRNIEHNLCELIKYHRGYCRGKFTERTIVT